MQYLLYNPISGNGGCRNIAEAYMADKTECTKLVDITKIDSYKTLFEILDEEDSVVIFGGDGTVNRFVNDLDGLEVKNSVYYYPAGSGNDFATDIGKKDTTEPFLLNGYINNLPTVNVNGENYKFINGVGYGIDGY